MQATNLNRKPENKLNSKKPQIATAKGPSHIEMEYLRQLKKELEIFLKSRNFSTIQEIQVGFTGKDYAGLMQVSA